MATQRRRITKSADGTVTIHGPTARQIARWAAHVSSGYATCLLVQALLGDNIISLLVGVLVELILYKGKALLWESSQRDIWGLACLLLDTVTNAGGMWPNMMRLNNTNVWRMIAEAFALGGEVRALPALILAMVAGFLLAVAPFALEDDK